MKNAEKIKNKKILTLIALLIILSSGSFLLFKSDVARLTVAGLDTDETPEEVDRTGDPIDKAGVAEVNNEEQIEKAIIEDKAASALQGNTLSAASYTAKGNYKCYNLTNNATITPKNSKGYYRMPASNASPHLIFNKNDKLPEVKVIKKTLKDKGRFSGSTSDATYDDTLRKAVEKFQDDNDLGVDGKVGNQTADKLGIKNKIIERYRLNDNGGSPRDQQYGKKETINILLTAFYNYDNSKYKGRMVSVGDLNASGHNFHKKGTSVDLYSNDGLFKKKPGHKANKNYNRAYAKQLAKYLLATNAINFIIYDDKTVVAEIEKWRKEKGLRGKIKQTPDSLGKIGDHDDHFHVEINPKINCNNGISQ